MSQLTFRFPFKTNYFEEDFYVAANNFNAYKLIESWPNWPGKNINIFGPSGCGKTHLANIFNKRIDSYILKASEINEQIVPKLRLKNFVIIDEYDNNINEKLFYSVLNQSFQVDQYIVVSSKKPIKKINVKLNDLKSRLDSFIDIGIDLPTDDLIRVILTKTFSDKQIKIEIKLLEYILKNIDRSYEEVFRFIDNVDTLSLSAGKSININLIKKVLNK
jgi:chromosomal replication initiation ATPase DnaA